MDIAVSVGDFGNAAQGLRMVAAAVYRACESRFGVPPPAGERPITIFRAPDGIPRTPWPTYEDYRIAVVDGESNYPRFVYHLAHELAHVWMHPSGTNAVVEAYAVALSLQVLTDIAQVWRDTPSVPGWESSATTFIPYAHLAVWHELVHVPVSIQRAVEERRWSDVSAYLRSQKSVQDENPINRALNMTGAILLLAHGIVWPDLVGVARLPLPDDAAGHGFFPHLALALDFCPQSVRDAAALLGFE